ncbi:unnamed protein product [Leptidea sinapis]|uniref:Uncharacterized protein n=1 Tax=Leptidea sinapis TaxID=189913 RepID=A0A5E4QE08_9NEOP|nr:unnamed protein product [Leptidea sinapis]
MMAFRTSLLATKYSTLVTRFASSKNLPFTKTNLYLKCTSHISQCQQLFFRSLSSMQQESLNFRQLGPKNHFNKDCNILDVSKPQYDILKTISRSYVFKSNENIPKKNKRRIPKLILLQNPFKWILNKIDFTVLRRVWDPTFREKEFKLGTKQPARLSFVT